MLFAGDDEAWLFVDDNEVRSGVDDEVGWMQMIIKCDCM